LAEDLAVEAVQTMAELMRNPTTPAHVRAALADKLLDRGIGKVAQALDVNQTTSFSEDFEAFVRRLNDKHDVAAQRLQDEAAVDIIEVDFEALERREGG